MSSNLNFDFSVNRENKTIKVKREFAAELSIVWNAYTKSEILDQWWAPKPWKASTKTMDFRVGGHWLYAMVGPEGEVHWSRADYIDIEHQKKFTGLDAFTDAEGNVNTDIGQSRWEVTFTGKGPHTLVEILMTFDNAAQLDTMIGMGMKEGLAMAMEGLDELLPSLRK